MSLRTPRSTALAFAALALGSVAVSPAATYTITVLGEDADENGNCTLREALLAATTDNTQDACIGDAGADTIVLSATGSYELDDGDLTLQNRLLVVTGDADQPASAYVVDLGNALRFLALEDASLTLRNLTLFDGVATGAGGAILADDSDLTLEGVVVESCESGSNGGAIAFLTSASVELDIVQSVFVDNGSTGAVQTYGGAVDANLVNAGDVRVLATTFLDNWIVSTSEGYSRSGGGLSVRSSGAGAVELRHLVFDGNVVDVPDFGTSAGLYLVQSGATGALLVEDLLFEANQIVVGASSATALEITADAPTASVRRIRAIGNLGATGRRQIDLSQRRAAPLVVSDVLVAGGDGVGMILDATGNTGCSVVAGNLTVTGHPDYGLGLVEGPNCPLRIENSILYGNGDEDDVNVFTGSPDLSAENLIGVDPGFLNAAGDDYRLGPSSVAAEAGDAEFASVGPFDAAHGPRVVEAELDLGAFERGALFEDDFEHGDRYPWDVAVGD
jgi:hypothetical protein